MFSRHAAYALMGALVCGAPAQAQLLTRSDLPLKPRMLQLSLRVDDPDVADAFYTKALGLVLKNTYSPAPGIVERFYGFEGADRSATLIALGHSGSLPRRTDRKAADIMSADVSFNLTVPDVKAIVARVEQYGGRVVRPTVTRAAGPFQQDMAFVADPDGNIIELTHFY